MNGSRPVPGGARFGMSRRSFVGGAAGIGIVLALDACSGSHSSAPSPYTGDLRSVALAAALENQAVDAYRAVHAALGTGRFGPQVPALAAFVQTALEHHSRHAETWNAILRDARKPAVSGAPLSGHARLMKTIGAATGQRTTLAHSGSASIPGTDCCGRGPQAISSRGWTPRATTGW